jgi:hypothetical protein
MFKSVIIHIFICKKTQQNFIQRSTEPYTSLSQMASLLHTCNKLLQQECEVTMHPRHSYIASNVMHMCHACQGTSFSICLNQAIVINLFFTDIWGK